MKKVFLILLIVISISFVSCTTEPEQPVSPNISMSGRWTSTNITTYTSNIYVFEVGVTTTAKFTAIDNSGSLTITDFILIGADYISWNKGSGSFNPKTYDFSVYLSGSYLNTYYDTVSVTVNFNGKVNNDQISGSGTFIEVLNVYGDQFSCSGTSTFFKG